MRPLSYLLSLLLVAPFAVLVIVAVGAPGPGEAIFLLPFARSFFSSSVAAVSTAALACALGASSAAAVFFIDFAGKRVIERLLVLPLLFPSFLVAAIYRRLLPFEVESGWGFVICLSVTLYPYAYLLCRLAFAYHGAACFDLGRSLGLGPIRSAVTILLPASLPAILLAAGLVFLEAASDQATASTLAVNTGATALYDLWFLQNQPRLAARLSFIFVIAALLAGALLWRRLHPKRFGLAPAAAARSPGRLSVSRSAGSLLLALCTLPVLLGFGIPLGVVLIDFGRTVHRVRLSAFLSSCLSSVGLTIAVVIACALVTAILIFVARVSADRIAGFLVAFLSLSFLLPAITVALGVLMLVSRSLPFVERFDGPTSFLLLVFALCLRFSCFLLIPVCAGLFALPQRLEEVGSSLGLDPGRSLVALYLPQLKRFALLGVMLITCQILKEVPITLILRPFGFQPIVLAVYGQMRIDMLAESAAWVLALLLLGAYPLLTLESLLTRDRISGG